MNENPGGTPNPLNSNNNGARDDEILDANPSEPIQEADFSSLGGPNNYDSRAGEHTFSQRNHQAPSNIPGSQSSVSPTGGAYRPRTNGRFVNEEEKKVINVSVNSLDPTGRPMEQTVEIAPEPVAKPKKKGLIFAIIGCVCLLIGIVAAVAAVMMTPKKTDPVADAVKKIMNGQMPNNVSVDGDISVILNDSSLPVKRLNIALNSKAVLGSMINDTSAELSLTDSSNNTVSANINEVYSTDGDIYFELDGITEFLEESSALNLLTINGANGTTGTVDATNCVDDGTGTTNCAQIVTDCAGDETDCATISEESVTSEGMTTSGSSAMQSAMLDMVKNVAERIDGTWLRIAADELESMKNNMAGDSGLVSCATNFMTDFNQNSNTAFETYDKYPFISSAEKGSLIASKQNPVYAIRIDSDALTEYINAINNTKLGSTLYTCMGWNNNASITKSDVAKIVDKLPEMQVEIDKDNNFTRLYITSSVNDGMANLTVDLNFSYPTNVNIPEPVEYTDYSTFMQSLMSGMLNPNGVVDGQTVTPETPSN